MFNIKRKLLVGGSAVGVYFAAKKFNFNKLFRKPAAADDDILLDESVLPEFSISLEDSPPNIKNKYDWISLKREDHLKAMMHKDKVYDLLIIGGGWNGAGVALDAASRGLSVALIDKEDFGSATSSKSTKLAHGGVRYLEQIIKREGDVKMSYHLLKEALCERNYFLDWNPFLNKEIEIVIPDNSFLRTWFWNFPGLVVYHLIYLVTSIGKDFISSIHGPRIVIPSDLNKKRNARFNPLKGLFGPSDPKSQFYYGSLMHEVQFSDTRQSIMSLITSTIDKYEVGMKGANIANYCEFQDFIKNDKGKIVGAKVWDKIDEKCFNINARAVVNWTGVFADKIRLLDNPKAKLRMWASRGTHLVFDKDIIPNKYGYILANTSDGRLIFILPYNGYTIVGTTDDMQEIEFRPQPQKSDLDFLREELKRLLGDDFDFDGKLKSSFAGLRPLLIAGGVEQSEYEEKLKTLKSKDLWRNHEIETSQSGLVSLLGGKWTSYRIMGEEWVDSIIKTHGLNNMTSTASKTTKIKLIGAYSKLELHDNMIIKNEDVVTKYKNQMMLLYDIPEDVADRLIVMYGTASMKIVKQGFNTPKFGTKPINNEFQNSNVRIHDTLPILESEVYYLMENELAIKPDDVIWRRLGISFVNKEVIPSIE